MSPQAHPTHKETLRGRVQGTRTRTENRKGNENQTGAPINPWSSLGVDVRAGRLCRRRPGPALTTWHCGTTARSRMRKGWLAGSEVQGGGDRLWWCCTQDDNAPMPGHHFVDSPFCTLWSRRITRLVDEEPRGVFFVGARLLRTDTRWIAQTHCSKNVGAPPKSETPFPEAHTKEHTHTSRSGGTGAASTAEAVVVVPKKKKETERADTGSVPHCLQRRRRSNASPAGRPRCCSLILHPCRRGAAEGAKASLLPSCRGCELLTRVVGDGGPKKFT